MSKLVITQEQADVIERLKEYHRDEIERFKRNPNNFADWLFPIKGMQVDDIEKAYRDGYEVESEFEENDWIVHKMTNDMGEIMRINANGTIHCDNSMGGAASHFRHATPEEIAQEKERRWFKKHGRDPWELKEEDILIRIGSARAKTVYRVCPATGSVIFYGDAEWAGKYVIRTNYLVACFAEDRKDIDAE